MNIAIIEDELLTADDLAELVGNLGPDIQIVAILDSVKKATDFFPREDIAAAVDKYKRLKRHFVPREIDYDKLIRAITGDKPAPKKLNSILVYHRDKVIPVPIEQVALFYIHNDLTHLHCLDGRSFIVNQALDELEELTGSAFFRVNRQYLVSRGAIKDANHYMPRKYVVNLSIHFKEALVVSKNRTTDFLEWLTRE